MPHDKAETRLWLPDLLHHLEHNDLAIFDQKLDGCLVADTKHPRRLRLAENLLRGLHAVPKIVFSPEHGSFLERLRARSTVTREARRLAARGALRLPDPLIWIETPLTEEDGALGVLAKEEPGGILVLSVRRRATVDPEYPDVRYELSPPHRLALPPPADPRAAWGPTLPGVGGEPVLIETNYLQREMYAFDLLLGLLVSLAMPPTVQEPVPGGAHGAAMPERWRQYPRTIVRVPAGVLATRDEDMIPGAGG